MIRLEKLTRTFSQEGGEVVAVRDVSLQIAKGECVCLIGGSGCGKTTTLRLINRLLEPT
ncbi:MAG: ATP-binding cassette domain-containing protein, partial [Gemmatimonadota bacterium]